VLLQEPIAEKGEHIEDMLIEYMDTTHTWHPLAHSHQIGHKRIVRFATAKVSALRITSLSSRAEPLLSTLTAHYVPQPADTVAVARSGLMVGVNYHPHDNKDPQKIQSDIALMHAAGFNVVRLGHLAWDSFQPREGEWDFAWFDQVMDAMAQSGLKVVLDIATRPAPLWLHQKHPDIDITDSSGNRLYANHRYMEDVGNPDYQRYALQLTDTLTKRYAHHPALYAFGMDNEPGDGPISYSESVRTRFVQWLKDKYVRLDALNRAWASQRWSRKIGEWNEVGLPQSGDVAGAPERQLDFRRFLSDDLNAFYARMLSLMQRNAPQALTTTNAWYYSASKYFDYAPIAYSDRMKRQGFGFYPGGSLHTYWGLMDNLFGITRIQFENDTPFWCNEFTTMTAAPGSMRRAAYASLLYGNELVCGWTWQSMHGGEEQYLQGLLDWDGVPNRKYEEYARIAQEFKKISPYFPYVKQSEVGLAYNFESQMLTAHAAQSHDRQVQTAFDALCKRNLDVNMLDLRYSQKPYKLMILAGLNMVDSLTAQRIKDFVYNGGVVVMTSNSAMADPTGQIYSTTRPGLLADLFGIRLGGIEDTATMNECSATCTGSQLQVDYKGHSSLIQADSYDVIHLNGASAWATIQNFGDSIPLITKRSYGRGKAIYMGVAAHEGLLGSLLDDLLPQIGVAQGPAVPSEVMAREVAPHKFMYLNLSGETKVIPSDKPSRSLLYDGRTYSHDISLPPYEVEFVEF
jgi:beta-galactosidase